jgi:hypothetical protein
MKASFGFLCIGFEEVCPGTLCVPVPATSVSGRYLLIWPRSSGSTGEYCECPALVELRECTATCGSVYLFGIQNGQMCLQTMLQDEETIRIYIAIETRYSQDYATIILASHLICGSGKLKAPCIQLSCSDCTLPVLNVKCHC